jgi:DivIVA domain-containing protein
VPWRELSVGCATIAVVLTVLTYLLVMVAVAAVVYLFASLVFGRGEELAPLAPGATPTMLPAVGITGDDVRTLRFQQVMRGYRMSEVDWALSRLASELDELQGRLAELEGRLGPRAERVDAEQVDLVSNPDGADP